MSSEDKNMNIGPRRRRISWIQNMRQQTGLETVQELMKMAENRET